MVRQARDTWIQTPVARTMYPRRRDVGTVQPVSENKNFPEISVSFICRKLKNPDLCLSPRVTGDMDEFPFTRCMSGNFSSPFSIFNFPISTCCSLALGIA